MKPRNALIKNRKRAARLWRARHKRWRESERGKYTKARRNALDRGIEWHFTFESWLKKWKDSGHFEKRGRGPGCYHMARLGDCGPYAEWNTAIVRMESNAAALLILEGRATQCRPELREEVAQIL